MPTSPRLDSCLHNPGASHSRWCLLGLLVTLNLAALPARSDNTAEDPQVRQWLTGLGSDSFIQRDFAGRQLTDLGEEAVAGLQRTAQGDDPRAAPAAITLLERMALGDDRAAGASAHRALAQIVGQADSLPPPQAEQATTALRRAQRHVVAAVTALGGEVTRDDNLAIVAVKINDIRFHDEHAAIFKRLAGLDKLDLHGTGITNEALPAIGTLTSLDELNLSDTAITAAGLRQLESLKGLKKLSLYHLEIQADDVRRLNTQLPECDIRR